MEMSFGEKIVILELATKMFSSDAMYNYEQPVRVIDIYNEMISALSGETPREKTQAGHIKSLWARIEELEAEVTKFKTSMPAAKSAVKIPGILQGNKLSA